MGSGHNMMQDILDRLTPYDRETRSLVKLRRARTIFNRKVFKRAEDGTAFHLLNDTETGPSSEVKGNVHKVLEKWANGNPFFAVVLERLPMHLNLPVRTYPEDCYILQALVLGEGLPPALITLYAEDSVDENPAKTKEELTFEMREFSMRCARMLTLSLLNFCHREFLLLPCTVRLDEGFTAKTLQQEIDGHLGDAREYYGGPEALGKVTCDELVRAVTIAATITNVPCFLCGGTDQKKARDFDIIINTIVTIIVTITIIIIITGDYNSDVSAPVNEFEHH
ncbi:uncharacterized protein [Littorina saxatilis]|uniref:uncharacterized protein n=1 Tax=Littorina saxatilis TaxID=31220 RepID=UPI0038B58DA5